MKTTVWNSLNRIKVTRKNSFGAQFDTAHKAGIFETGTPGKTVNWSSTFVPVQRIDEEALEQESSYHCFAYAIEP